MSSNYILEGRTPVVCDDLLKWGAWFETADRHVLQTVQDDVRVSTVFLGLDHSFGNGPPLLFESMVFGGPHDQELMDRYSTWEEAEAGHSKMCSAVFNDESVS